MAIQLTKLFGGIPIAVVSPNPDRGCSLHQAGSPRRHRPQGVRALGCDAGYPRRRCLYVLGARGDGISPAFLEGAGRTQAAEDQSLNIQRHGHSSDLDVHVRQRRDGGAVRRDVRLHGQYRSALSLDVHQKRLAGHRISRARSSAVPSSISFRRRRSIPVSRRRSLSMTPGRRISSCSTTSILRETWLFWSMRRMRG